MKLSERALDCIILSSTERKKESRKMWVGGKERERERTKIQGVIEQGCTKGTQDRFR